MRYAVVLLFLFLSVSGPAYAKIFHVTSPKTFGPLPVRTQNPLYLRFISMPLEKTTPTPKGEFVLSLETTFSNLFERNIPATGTGVDMDMELVRTAFKTNYGLFKNMTLGMELPFLSFSGGFLDSFIQGYHNAFGFPNAGRQNVDNGRFSYQLFEDGVSFYQTDQAVFRLGDVVLSQKLKVIDERKKIPAVALKTSLKIPTGSLTQGTGSHRPDFGLSLLFEKSHKRLHGFTQIGFLALGGDSRLRPILTKGGAFFSQALEFNLFEHLSLVSQIDFVSSLFKNTDITELNQEVFDLTFGFTGEVETKKYFKKIFYKASFTEDPLSRGPSIDFTLFFDVGVCY